MATKAPAKTELVTPDNYGDIIDGDSLNPALVALKAQFGVDTELDPKVYVYWIDPNGGADMRVYESSDPDSYDLKAIAKKFGSGKYRLRVYANNGQGSKPCVINTIQGIMLLPEEEAAVLQAKERARNPPPPANTAADMQNVVASMMAGFQQTVTQLLQAQQQAPKADPFEMIGKLGEVMRAMQPPAAPQQDFMSVLNMVKTFNEVTGAGKIAAPEGATASETLMLEAARSLMPAIAQGLQKQQGGATPAPVANEAPQPAQLPGPQLSEEEQEKIMFLQLKLKAANRSAAKGADPQTFAEEIYDLFDDNDVIGMALNPQWFDVLCATLPDCAQHRAWYEGVRAALIDFAVEDEVLARDAAGVLTVAADPGTKDADDNAGVDNGTITSGGAT